MDLGETILIHSLIVSKRIQAALAVLFSIMHPMNLIQIKTDKNIDNRAGNLRHSWCLLWHFWKNSGYLCEPSISDTKSFLSILILQLSLTRDFGQRPPLASVLWKLKYLVEGKVMKIPCSHLQYHLARYWWGQNDAYPFLLLFREKKKIIDNGKYMAACFCQYNHLILV